jgi:PAS domain S-box-containing protein
LGQFASLAYQTVKCIKDLKLQIAAREQAETAVRALASGLEAKIRRLVDSNIIGIFIWDLDGRIIDANEAFLRIVGYGRDDLTSGQLRWRELTPAEWREADDRRVAELKATGTAHPSEKEYFHKSGGRVPVLVGAASFEERSDEGVAFVLDLTDRKRAEWAARESERRYSLVQMELAHANRVATMGTCRPRSPTKSTSRSERCSVTPTPLRIGSTLNRQIWRRSAGISVLSWRAASERVR